MCRYVRARFAFARRSGASFCTVFTSANPQVWPAAPAPSIDQSPSGTSTGRVSLLGPSLDHVPDGAGVRAQDAEVSWSHQVISVDELVRSPPCSTAAPNASDAGPAPAASPGP